MHGATEGSLVDLHELRVGVGTDERHRENETGRALWEFRFSGWLFTPFGRRRASLGRADQPSAMRGGNSPRYLWPAGSRLQSRRYVRRQRWTALLGRGVEHVNELTPDRNTLDDLRRQRPDLEIFLSDRQRREIQHQRNVTLSNSER